MIPLTVSYFLKQSSSNSRGLINALVYAIFIVLIYLILSLPFHFIDSLNPEFLNTIATNIFLNLIFFVVFIIFAFSFFGFYELTLPTSWSMRTDNSSSLNTFIGIFFMALTLAIVSFSCTGPILGSLLVGSLTSEGGAFQLSIGMLGFGLALGLPFGLLAIFPKIHFFSCKCFKFFHSPKIRELDEFSKGNFRFFRISLSIKISFKCGLKASCC